MALVATLAFAAFAAPPAPAPAAEPSAPSPASFAISVVGDSAGIRLLSRRGRTLRGSVRVRNLSGRSIRVRLQRADIRNATGGGADDSTARPSAAGLWIKLAAGTVTVAPRASRRVPFSVRIPRRISRASHYAGIVGFDAAGLMAADREKKRRGTITISRISRQALPIRIQRPGRLTRSLAPRSVGLAVEPAGAGLVLGLRPGGTILTQSAPPTEGSSLVRGVRRQGSAPAYVNRTIASAPAKELKRGAPPVARVAPTEDARLPMRVWVALAGGGALLLSLSLAIWKLAARGRDTAGAP